MYTCTLGNNGVGKTEIVLAISDQDKKGSPMASSMNAIQNADDQQAGDLFLDFAVDQIDRCRNSLATITAAAEVAAERIVSRHGQLLAAGDDSFTMEFVWAAGGIAFAKRWKPDLALNLQQDSAAINTAVPYYQTVDYEDQMYSRGVNSNDVILLGYENERLEQANLGAYANELLAANACVILFASEAVARDIQTRYGSRPNLILITHEVADGGIIDVPGWPSKVCSGRSFIQRLNLWVFQTELIGAFLRRGKIPGILLSVTYESPQIHNLPLIHSYRFVPAFDVTPAKEGELGETYLKAIRQILTSIIPGQRQKFRQATQWMAEAIENGHKVFALLIHGVNPIDLPGDPNLFTVYVEGDAIYPELGKACTKDDVALFLGYNWYPPELAETVDAADGKLILCITTVQNQPPRPVMYGSQGPLLHVDSLEQLPKHKSHIYIDEKWSEYDAVLKIPDYTVRAASSSRPVLNVLYWHFVADTVELLAKRRPS
jgi:hypothetical protein